MRISFEYDEVNDLIVLTPSDFPPNEWERFTITMIERASDIVRFKSSLNIPYKSFLSMRSEISKYKIVRGLDIKFVFSEKTKALLEKANSKSYKAACKTADITEAVVQEKLNSVGFTRKLTDNQMLNVCHLAPLPAGATFSVPGAGKTTEALAYFFCNASCSDHLLVVGPLSAMGAWEEQMNDCCPEKKYQFVRLQGGEKTIDRLLREDPRFMLISYEQFPTVSHLLRQFLKKHSVFMFLDESHRIKGGSGVRAQEILALSCFPERKLIMSGTPCPQAIDDLIPQFEFLYPGSRINKYTVSDAFKPIFVRTTKEQLGLPPVNRCIKFVPMDPLQEKLYKFLTSEISRQPLLASTKYRLKELQKKIVKIMKFVSNPTLLTEEIGDAFRKEELDQVLASSGCGPKINYACKRARELAKQGEKVIIWSQFVANVKIISDRLQDFGADYICGEVASGDEDEENRREWKIKQFHENPEKMVLVLNPAAASEAISLHKACHHAIYVDRSFNAAHYLQSEDRIHRLGSTVSPEIEIVMCRGTIDEVVEERLKIKVQAMAELLNDTSLTICALDNTDDTGNTSGEDEGSSISREDVEAIFKHLIEVNNV